MPDAITSQGVSLVPLAEDAFAGELAEKTYSSCSFCSKTVGLENQAMSLIEQLSGSSGFYCPFCLRHRFNEKTKKDFLLLSFRGIIAYYYYWLYKEKSLLSYSEILDYVNAQKATGLANPYFIYDEDSFIWFVDFSRVGRRSGRMKLNTILETVINILCCFNLCQNVPNVEMSKYFERYDEAIRKFHSNRYRPADRFQCVPTLNGCMSDVTSTTSTTGGYAHAGYHQGGAVGAANKKPPKTYDHNLARSFQMCKFCLKACA